MKATILIENRAELEGVIARIQKIMADPKYDFPFEQRLIELDGESTIVLDAKKKSSPEEPKKRRGRPCSNGYKKSDRVS